MKAGPVRFDAEALRSGLAAVVSASRCALPDGAQEQLLRYLELLVRWNGTYNLTAVRHPKDMLVQHLADCLAVVQPVRRELEGSEGRVLDVGSGAGLPGVVLAIACGRWQVTCVDAVGKKAAFVQQVAAELGLSHLKGRHARVEKIAEPRDLIVSRAFASLVDFVALSRGAMAPGGRWCAMKARLEASELQFLPADIRVFHVEQLVVAELGAPRCLVWMGSEPSLPGDMPAQAARP